MAGPPTMPRIIPGTESAYPQHEELSASEASRKLRDVVREFLEEAQAWAPRDRGEPTEDDGEET